MFKSLLMLKSRLKYSPLIVGLLLLSGSPSFAADATTKKEPIGEKEQRIIESGRLAIEAEKRKPKEDEFVFPSAVELYTDDELNELIAENRHLQRVKADDCQLVEDIRARAELVKLPSYQFLWGDMLSWGVCVRQNIELGIYYVRASAFQGQPRALEQLGRYYVQGQFVQRDIERALPLFIQSSRLGFLPAKIQLAELLILGYGSPYDYQESYSFLYSSVIADPKTHERVTQLLGKLESLMPEQVVIAAKKAAKYN